MKLDFSQVLLNLSGESLRHSDGSDLTLEQVCSGAMLTEVEGDRVDGVEKYKRFKTAKKILDPESNFSVEEIALMKSQIGKVWSTNVVGPAYDLLDSPIVEKKSKK